MSLDNHHPFGPEVQFLREINLAEFLALLGHEDGDIREHVAMCWQVPGGRFDASIMRPREAPRFLDRTIHLRRCCWVSVNPVRFGGRGRGKARDVVRLADLFTDLDHKPGGCEDPEVAFAVIAEVSKTIGMRPSMVTYSGHGWQPHWPMERESGLALMEASGWQGSDLFLKRFGLLVADVAGSHGAKVDPVFDIARVLRTPGTVNWKQPEDPVPVRCILDDGRPVTVEQVTHALDAAGIPAQVEKKRAPKKPAPKRTSGRGGTNGSGRSRYSSRYTGHAWNRVQPFTRKCLIERVRQAPEGKRNTTLFGAARDAARCGYDDEAMREALAEAAEDALLNYEEIGPSIASGFAGADEDDEFDMPQQIGSTS